MNRSFGSRTPLGDPTVMAVDRKVNRAAGLVGSRAAAESRRKKSPERRRRDTSSGWSSVWCTKGEEHPVALMAGINQDKT